MTLNPYFFQHKLQQKARILCHLAYRNCQSIIELMKEYFNDSNFRRFDGKNDREFPHRDLTDRILGAAIYVHRYLGPGFLEKIYENALCLEFSKRKIIFSQQVPIFVRYEGDPVGMHRLDLLIENKIVVEIKACREIEEIHFATVLSYLKATQLEAGLILNYFSPTLKIRRVVYSKCFAAESRSGDDNS